MYLKKHLLVSTMTAAAIYTSPCDGEVAGISSARYTAQASADSEEHRVPVRETKKQRFDRLASEWKKNTWHLSSSQQMAIHPAYQAIIGMGHDALPHIIAEIKKKPGHWFWALRAIVYPEDPAKEARSLNESVSAWVAWWEANRAEYVAQN